MNEALDYPNFTLVARHGEPAYVYGVTWNHSGDRLREVTFTASHKKALYMSYTDALRIAGRYTNEVLFVVARNVLESEERMPHPSDEIRLKAKGLLIEDVLFGGSANYSSKKRYTRK